MESFSFVAPTAYWLDYGVLFSDKSKVLTFGLTTSLGVVMGAWLVSVFTKTFRWEGFATTEDLVNHVIGGTLMGFGGITALGCTIGQGISGFSTLALGSILTFLAIVAGSAATMKWQYWRISRE